MLEAMSGAKQGGVGVITSYEEAVSMMQASRKGQVSSGKDIDTAGLTNGNGYITVQLSNEALVRDYVYGSAWGSYMWWGTTGKRCVQHCAPTLDIWNMLVDSNALVMLKLGPRISGSGYWNGANHNGFSSQSYGSNTSGWRVLDFIYWNSLTNQCERNVPASAQTVPKLFDGKLI